MKKDKVMKTQVDVYEIVTARFIEALEQGT